MNDNEAHGSRTGPTDTRSLVDLAKRDVLVPGTADEPIPDLKQLLHKSQRSEDFEYGRHIVHEYLVAHSDTALDAADCFKILASMHLSVKTIPGYASLDSMHIGDINKMVGKIADYAHDTTRTRPLNLLLLASPGSGKSHLVECIAKSPMLNRHRVEVVAYNMSTLRVNDDLAGALDASRNVKVDDRIPLLFLDEFDSMSSNYGLLLPLLWDGKFSVGQRELRMGRIVIVLAGSSDSLQGTWEEAIKMFTQGLRQDQDVPKIVDLFSRINGGVLRLPPLEQRQTDKVLIATQILRKRFPELQFIARGLFEFIANVRFKYDVRSLVHLVDEFHPPQDATMLRVDDLRSFPKDVEALEKSNLAQHLFHPQGSLAISQLWNATVNGTVGADLVPVFDDSLSAAVDAETLSNKWKEFRKRLAPHLTSRDRAQ